MVYTRSAGWLGYDDEKVAALVRQVAADGFQHIKMKDGGALDSDARGRRSSAASSDRRAS